MGFACGVIGLPKGGKSTVFNALGHTHPHNVLTQLPLALEQQGVVVCRAFERGIERIDSQELSFGENLE